MIALDFDMPNSCSQCPCEQINEDNTSYCIPLSIKTNLLESYTDQIRDRMRLSNCPLIDLKSEECKP